MNVLVESLVSAKLCCKAVPDAFVPRGRLCSGNCCTHSASSFRGSSHHQGLRQR